MFKSSYLGLTPEEEKKAIKEIIKFQTDLIAKKLKNNSYGDTQKKMKVDLLCLFGAVYAYYYGMDKGDNLLDIMNDNIKKKYN